MVARRCGTIPATPPSAAKTLARRPWMSPVDTEYTTPVPGTSTTTKDVTRNSRLSMRDLQKNSNQPLAPRTGYQPCTAWRKRRKAWLCQEEKRDSVVKAPSSAQNISLCVSQGSPWVPRNSSAPCPRTSAAAHSISS